MNAAAFLDTNVLVRHLVQDQPDHSSRASWLFERIATDQITAYISETVIFECVYVLEKQFGIPKREIAEGVKDVLDIPGLVLPNRTSIVAALTFWTEHGGLSFADCYHLALTDHWGLEHIYTFDKKMDRYPSVTRIEL